MVRKIVETTFNFCSNVFHFASRVKETTSLLLYWQILWCYFNFSHTVTAGAVYYLLYGVGQKNWTIFRSL